MKKCHEVSNSDSCLSRAADDEPLFVLRAQDKLAPVVVRVWADVLEAYVGEGHPKIVEARELAEEMERWQHRKIPD